ncbi:hypothetical protein POL72_33925 [Sorangium sp. wiwo2]|uniref:Uncharacterized protein n=1 Tax=Sorangium atrum TaxID=2995308 RepID=A0ABT5C8Q7_9BACT|nr:hypothetical protein [Sorangium aterium]MDC0682775.1 hypothetical protein [Sorangium aterium]
MILGSRYVTEGIVHIAFTSRRGLPPAVRAPIEHLASHIHDDVMKRTTVFARQMPQKVGITWPGTPEIPEEPA